MSKKRKQLSNKQKRRAKQNPKYAIYVIEILVKVSKFYAQNAKKLALCFALNVIGQAKKVRITKITTTIIFLII